MAHTKKKKLKKKKKLAPYLATKDEGQLKFKADICIGHNYPTKSARDEARRANRSRKKAARQEANKDIKKELEK